MSFINNFVINQTTKKVKLRGIHNMDIETAKRRGLYTPKTENPTICLKILMTNAQRDNIKNIVMSSIGNQ